MVSGLLYRLGTDMALSRITNGGVASSGLPSGSIIQVQRTQFTGVRTITHSANTDTVVSDLTVNITPISTSSIIRIDGFVQGEFDHINNQTDGVWFFFRDSTKLAHPVTGNRKVGINMGTNITYYDANASSTPEGCFYTYFDTPSSTSQITYKVAFDARTAGDWYLNHTVTDSTNNDYNERGISSITVTEIAG